jgi:hypothetical protein
MSFDCSRQIRRLHRELHGIDPGMRPGRGGGEGAGAVDAQRGLPVRRRRRQRDGRTGGKTQHCADSEYERCRRCARDPVDQGRAGDVRHGPGRCDVAGIRRGHDVPLVVDGDAQRRRRAGDGGQHEMVGVVAAGTASRTAAAAAAVTASQIHERFISRPPPPHGRVRGSARRLGYEIGLPITPRTCSTYRPARRAASRTSSPDEAW